jgi:hypothetical protein
MKGDDMSLLERTAQRLLDTVGDSLDSSPEATSRHKGARRVAYMAGGFALLTAASAGISSLRDRFQPSRDSIATRT